MHKFLKVAQREYLETVKTKVFIFSLLMAPLIVCGIIFFVSRTSLDKIGPRPPIKVAVSDLTNQLTAELESRFGEYSSLNPNRQIQLRMLETEQDTSRKLSDWAKTEVREKRFDIYIVLEDSILDGPGQMQFYTCGLKPAEIDMPWTIENLINTAVVNRRCQLQEFSPQLLEKLRRRVPSKHAELSTAGDTENIKSPGQRVMGMMVPFFFMYLMFLGIVVTGQQMMTSVIEEKSSRVIEVLLSAISPFELMAGKILGLVGMGLTVMGIWVAAAYGAARWQGLDIEVTASLLIYFGIYYLLGFLFFSALLAGIGSICNSLKEAQTLMGPISLIFVLPLISWFNLVRNPQGVFARVLSFIPPLTPMVMVLRLSADSNVALVEIIASILVLIAAVVLAIWVAAKVFRTGILMYGKRPGLWEVLRWLRQS